MKLTCFFSLKDQLERLNSAFNSNFTRNIFAQDVEDRIRYLLKKEVKYLPNCDYMSSCQKETKMRPSWRARIVAWMFDFELEFLVDKHTILVAVNLVDRYLSIEPLEQEKLQLLAITSIFIATKLMERKPFRARHLAELAEKMYTVDDIKSMERRVIKALEWKLSPVTSLDFFDLFFLTINPVLDEVQSSLNFNQNEQLEVEVVNDVSYLGKACISMKKVEKLTKRFLYCTHFAYEFLQFPPSELALSSILCMLHALGIDHTNWSNNVFQKFGIDATALKMQQCCYLINQVYSRTFKIQDLDIFERQMKDDNDGYNSKEEDGDTASINDNKENIPPKEAAKKT